MNKEEFEKFLPEAKQKIINLIQMCPVYSSNLLAIGYNKEYKMLRVIFKNKTSYIYFNVDEDIWNNLSKSNSKGKTLNESVIKQKEKYQYLKLV